MLINVIDIRHYHHGNDSGYSSIACLTVNNKPYHGNSRDYTSGNKQLVVMVDKQMHHATVLTAYRYLMW